MPVPVPPILTPPFAIIKLATVTIPSSLTENLDARLELNNPNILLVLPSVAPATLNALWLEIIFAPTAAWPSERKVPATAILVSSLELVTLLVSSLELVTLPLSGITWDVVICFEAL